MSDRHFSGVSFFYSLPLRLRAKAARTSKRRRGLGIPFDDYYRDLCHVSCRTSRAIVAYIYTRARAQSLRATLCEKEREREGEKDDGARYKGPSLHKSALRPRRALSTWTSNKSKPRQQAWSFAIRRRRERESFINLRARATYCREQEALCHLVLAGWRTGPDARKVRVPGFSPVFGTPSLSLSLSFVTESTGESTAIASLAPLTRSHVDRDCDNAAGLERRVDRSYAVPSLSPVVYLSQL